MDKSADKFSAFFVLIATRQNERASLLRIFNRQSVFENQVVIVRFEFVHATKPWQTPNTDWRWVLIFVVLQQIVR